MIKEWWDYTLLMRASIATRVNFIMESVERPSCEPRGAQVIIIVSVAAPGMSPSLELFYIAQMWAGRLEFVTLLALVAEIIVSLNPKRRVLKS